MKNLSQRYVQYINRNYRRSGMLWEGRYKSCIAQSELYVLRCYRYIEVNPVRAKMVVHPGMYRWSSYHTNGQDEPSNLLSPYNEYLSLSQDDWTRRVDSRALFDSDMEPALIDEIRKATKGNYVLIKAPGLHPTFLPFPFSSDRCSGHAQFHHQAGTLRMRPGCL